MMGSGKFLSAAPGGASWLLAVLLSGLAGPAFGETDWLQRDICASFYNQDDYANAWKECSAMADSGDPEVLMALGFMAFKGKGTPADDDAAIRFYSDSSLQDNPQAQYNLGYVYEHRKRSPDMRRALQAYMRAADRGSRDGAYRAARILDEGSAGSADYPKALKYYKQAAYAGNPNAMINLGVMYGMGRGTQPDFVESYAWFSCGSREKSLKGMAEENMRVAAGRLPGRSRTARRIPRPCSALPGPGRRCLRTGPAPLRRTPAPPGC